MSSKKILVITTFLIALSVLLPVHAVSEEVRLYVYTAVAWDYDFDNATQSYPGTYTDLFFYGWTFVKAVGTGVEGTLSYDGPWGTIQEAVDLTDGYAQYNKQNLSEYKYPTRKLDISVVHTDVSKPAQWVVNVYARNRNDTYPQLIWYQAVIPEDWVQSAGDIAAYINGSTSGVAINPNVGNWTLLEGYSWQNGYHVSMLYSSLPPDQTVNLTIAVDLAGTIENPGWTPYSVVSSMSFLSSGTAKVSSIPDLPYDDVGAVRPDLTYKAGQLEVDATYSSVFVHMYRVTLPDPPQGQDDGHGRGGGRGHGNRENKVVVLRILPNGKTKQIEVPRQAFKGISHMEIG
ncbi:MAG: hypothetical protein ACE5GD_07230 [Candidatus Geothermarchaeales archaeon]